MKSNSKIDFGYDLLYLMRSIEIVGSKGKSIDRAVDALARVLMLFWDYSVNEIDEINRRLFNDMKSNKLPNYEESYKRILTHVKNKKEKYERLLIHLIALTCMGTNMTDIAPFIKALGQELDLRPSEMDEYIKKGNDLFIAFTYFGNEFSESRHKIK